MDLFTKILILASVLVLLGYYIQTYRNYLKEQKELTWPRHISPCPDYWVHEGNNVCRNIHNLGKAPLDKVGNVVMNGTEDFNSNRFKADGSSTSDQKKCRYAKMHNLSWEGIDKLCT